MNVEYSALVESDLQEIGDYIAGHNPERALTFIVEIRAKIYTLARNPLGYRLRPGIGPAVRSAAFGRYLILFRVLEGTIRIDRVVSGYRDLSALQP